LLSTARGKIKKKCCSGSSLMLLGKTGKGSSIEDDNFETFVLLLVSIFDQNTEHKMLKTSSDSFLSINH
jgi:hypothetical protein